MKISTLHIPYGIQKPPQKLKLTFTSKLKTPWKIGYIEGKKKSITINNDITKCLRSFFLQKLPKPKQAMQLQITLENFQVVVQKRRAYGYAKFLFNASWQGGIGQKSVVVRRVAKVKNQKDLEKLVIGICKEAAKIMKEQYALLAL